MEFYGKKERKKDPQLVSKYRFARRMKVEDDKEVYADPLTFYDQIPHVNLSPEEFEKYALARLKVLRVIERVNTESVEKHSDDWVGKIEKELRMLEKKTGKESEGITEFRTVYTPIGTEEAEFILASRKFDQISHFLLRLAFAGTEDRKKWFISLEVDLFRIRFLRLRTQALQLKEFLHAKEFPGVLLDEKEKGKENLLRDIRNACPFISEGSLVDTDIYKIGFTQALDLVRQRRVLLRDGFAYVTFNDLVSVMCGAYRTYLSESMSLVTKNMSIVERDERILNVVRDFDRRHTGSDYSGTNKNNTTGVSADELPTLSQKSFPLCMKTLYDIVVKEHHLKHFGRLQFGLFLKAVGLPIDESIKFWRTHFTKRPEIDGSRFDKQYLYNIRHMYGQEGRRADYTPYSCMKVITSNVGPGDYHGCPFKHSDATNLRQKLQNAQISADDVKTIMELVEKQHYQIACQKYFEFTHDSNTVEGGVNHPNQYFDESRDVLSGKKTLKALETRKTTNVKLYASQAGSQLTQKPESQVTQSQSEFPDDDEAMEIAELLRPD